MWGEGGAGESLSRTLQNISLKVYALLLNIRKRLQCVEECSLETKDKQS